LVRRERRCTDPRGTAKYSSTTGKNSPSVRRNRRLVPFIAVENVELRRQARVQGMGRTGHGIRSSPEWTGKSPPAEVAMRIQDVMRKDVKTIAPTAAAEDAWNAMEAHRIHHLVVTTAARIVGVLSDRDAGGRRGAAVRTNRTVAELMTAPVVTVDPTTTVRRAANLMRGHRIGCLVVAKRGRPLGIVTLSDLLELVGRGLDRGAASSQRRPLQHRVPHRKSKMATGVW
jgi:acetoin utilization protein AcuB